MCEQTHETRAMQPFDRDPRENSSLSDVVRTPGFPLDKQDLHLKNRTASFRT